MLVVDTGFATQMSSRHSSLYNSSSELSFDASPLLAPLPPPPPPPPLVAVPGFALSFCYESID
jgi:hypothetical protein